MDIFLKKGLKILDPGTIREHHQAFSVESKILKGIKILDRGLETNTSTTSISSHDGCMSPRSE